MKKLLTLIALVAACSLGAQSTIYIDPGYTGGNSDGSEAQPYTHWKDVLPITAGNTYLQKRGTVCETDTVMPLASNVTIGAYGEGDRPVVKFTIEKVGNFGVFYVLNTANNKLENNIANITVKDMVIAGGSVSACLLFEGNVTNVLVDHCELIGGVWGLRFLMWGHADRTIEDIRNQYSRVMHTTIHGTGEDGIYVDYNWSSLEIGFCNIYDINRKYFGEFGGSGASQYTAPGDCIQTGAGLYWPWIHHNVLDKSSTEYKFALIIATGESTPEECTIEYNRMIGQGRNTAAVFYLNSGVDAVVRGNVMSHGPNAIFNTGTNGSLVAYNNVFEDVNFAITNQSSTGVGFYNNTMIGCGAVAQADFNKSTNLYNNLCYWPDDITWDFLFKYPLTSTVPADRFDSDYNLVYPERAALVTFQGTAYSTLGAWTSAKGYDSHSIAVDPMITDVAAKDYRLASGSPAFGAGVVIEGITPGGVTSVDIGADMEELYTVGIGPDGAIPLMGFFSNSEDPEYGPFTVTDYRFIDTEGWIGWLDSYGTAPWLYCYNTGGWLYLPATSIGDNGAWTYVLK